MDDVSKLVEALELNGYWCPQECRKAAAALTAERERADKAEDLTWFWQIVDADGLTGVPSAEREALQALVRRAAERDDLTRKIQTVLDRESATTARYDAKIEDLERKLAEAVKLIGSLLGSPWHDRACAFLQQQEAGR